MDGIWRAGSHFSSRLEVGEIAGLTASKAVKICSPDQKEHVVRMVVCFVFFSFTEDHVYHSSPYIILCYELLRALPSNYFAMRFQLSQFICLGLSPERFAMGFHSKRGQACSLLRHPSLIPCQSLWRWGVGEHLPLGILKALSGWFINAIWQWLGPSCESAILRAPAPALSPTLTNILYHLLSQGVVV